MLIIIILEPTIDSIVDSLNEKYKIQIFVIKYKIGTLVIDSGRLGVIAAYYPRGSVDFGNAKQINWRDNYHLYFLKGKSYIMGR